MANPKDVGKAFVDHYYNTFDTNRSALGGLYTAEAMLTFEGTETQGQQAIQQKLSSLPFQQCKHHVASLDVQLSNANGIIVFATGQLLTEGESNPLKFSQVFHLVSSNNSFALTNDLFRLNYG
ncbi:hypothetical protein WJX74_009852 [Apatococcus lobatus]|uniref:NTF2 domain-containing protein n=1 Tax=Apatococcus lobatus TaxID=904363 RepID=A0AAW1RQ17_9CHLO